MISKENPFQKITNDRKFIINCYVDMLSRINEQEIITLIKSNPPEFSWLKKMPLPNTAEKWKTRKTLLL